MVPLIVSCEPENSAVFLTLTSVVNHGSVGLARGRWVRAQARSSRRLLPMRSHLLGARPGRAVSFPVVAPSSLRESQESLMMLELGKPV